MSQDSACLKGYLDFRARGTGNERCWQKRYYVLYTASERNAARLDWYEQEQDFRKNKTVRKTIYCEDISNVVPCQVDGRYTFKLEMVIGDKPHTFAAYLKEDVQRWVDGIRAAMETQRISRNSTKRRSKFPETAKSPTEPECSDEDTLFKENLLYESVESMDVYDVEAGDNKATRRCKLVGEYKLQITNVNLTLRDMDTSAVVYVWPYKYIRRYGRNALNFTFEAGRKCPSGEGLFSFKTPVADEIFEVVQRKTKDAKILPADPDPVDASADVDCPPTSVAARKKKLEQELMLEKRPPIKLKPQAETMQKTTSVSDPKRRKNMANSSSKQASNNGDQVAKQPLSPKNSNELKNMTQKLFSPAQNEVSLPTAKPDDPDDDGEDCVDGLKEPDYALYDAAASARFSQMDDYSEPCTASKSGEVFSYEEDDHMYSEPQEWADEPPKMSQIVAQMNKMHVRQKSRASDQYDQVDLCGGAAAVRRSRDSNPEHTYGQLSPVSPVPRQPLAQRPTPGYEEPAYDVVGVLKK